MKEQRIEYLNTAVLVPYARNSRTHSADQVAQIAGSIEEFGFTNPVLIDAGNEIIAGHGRVMAAQRLGMAEVPCIRIGYMTEAQKRAYVIADNQLALNAGWDEELLAKELAWLENEEFDLSLTGFDAGELENLLIESIDKIDGLTDPNEIPEPTEQPISRHGDIWMLGMHRVMCGDSSSKSDINKLIAGSKYDVIVFDPPYEKEQIYSEILPRAESGKKLIIFWDYKRFAIACSSAISAGWNPQYELIWDNVTSWYVPNRPLARHKACGIFAEDPYWNFDDAIIKDGKKRESKTVFNSRGKCNYVPLDGAVHMRTIESFPTTLESGGHKHSKPIDWIQAIINGIGGNILLDLFGGSGSTLIASEKTKRISLTMEIDPICVDIIIRRWQNYTGNVAVHADTGERFPAE